jgi:prevent-host-death family protein
MPTIRPSADLRNNYNEISKLCHEYAEPVFITKNGTGDLAVMSIETYELLSGKLELYSLLGEGLDQAENVKIKPMKETIKSIRNQIKQ